VRCKSAKHGARCSCGGFQAQPACCPPAPAAQVPVIATLVELNGSVLFQNIPSKHYWGALASQPPLSTRTSRCSKRSNSGEHCVPALGRGACAGAPAREPQHTCIPTPAGGGVLGRICFGGSPSLRPYHFLLVCRPLTTLTHACMCAPDRPRSCSTCVLLTALTYACTHAPDRPSQVPPISVRCWRRCSPTTTKP